MWSIDNLYWIFLSTGVFVGFGHCIGMCGPIVVSLSLNLKGKSIFLPHLLYNSGRIITYVVLGGIMGITGSFTIVVSNIAVIQKSAMMIAGLTIILMGFAMVGLIPFGRIFGNYSDPKGFVMKGFQKLSGSKSILVYFPLGLLLGLLPCGPVYTALISAARTGMDAERPFDGFYSGAAVMLCFGLGTVPALLVLARLTALKWLKSREMIYKVGALCMILMGVYFVIKGIVY